jgi:hypothetical protein
MSSEAVLDARFAALPRLIRAATNPHVTTADVRKFMQELLQADPALFQGALQFLSREGHGFVLLRHIGGPVEDARSWPRWPLKRLFSVRRASLITNPANERRALAIPFNVGTERHVVVAPLSEETFDSAQQTFLDTLQSVTTSSSVVPPVGERVPRFVWLGTNHALALRISAVARRRGWSLVTAPTLGHALIMLEHDRVDIALLDADALSSGLSSLRALRHAAKIGDAPIVYFNDAQCDPEIQTLIDFNVPVDADEAHILRVLKAATSLVSGMRTQALRASVERMEHQLRSCTDYAELADACAQAALLLGADAASVMLSDDSGCVYAAHLPFQTLLGDHWPTPFMTGETIAHTHAGDAFFDAAFDDREYGRRVRELHPVSAAVMPITNGSHITGTLLALSTRQLLFQPEFDALQELCDRTGMLASALGGPRARSGPWQRAVASDAMAEAFEGARSRCSVCVRSAGEKIAIVMLEREDARRAGEVTEQLLSQSQPDLRALATACKTDGFGVLLALVDEGQQLYFACDGLPVPLRIPLSGPVPLSRRAESCEVGTFVLDPLSLTFLYSNEFAAQVPTAQAVGAIQRGLRVSRATLARSLPGLGTSAQKLAFTCITTLSSAVDLPRQPALV